MNTIVTLIAYGPNSVKVPCRIFHPDDSLKTAKEKCDKLFGFEGELSEDYCRYNVPYKNIPTGEYTTLHKIVHKEEIKNYKNATILPNKIIAGKTKHKITYPNGFSHNFTYTYTSKKDCPDEELVFISFEEEEINSNDLVIADKVFTSYYGGCGEVWTYILKEIEFESKFVGFNLD